MVKYVGPAPSSPSDLVTKGYVDADSIKNYTAFANLDAATPGDFGYFEFPDLTPIGLAGQTGTGFVQTTKRTGSNLSQQLTLVFADTTGTFRQATYYERFYTTGAWGSWAPVYNTFVQPPDTGSGFRILIWDIDNQELTWQPLETIMPTGGGAGAFLVKNSATDRDLTWSATPPSSGSVMLSYAAGVWTWYTMSSAAATPGSIARRNNTGGTIFTGTPTDPDHATTKAYVDTALGTKLDASAAPELIRDTIATALVAGTNVTITNNDAGDTITIAATGGGGGGTTDYNDLTNAPTVELAVDGTTDIGPLVQAAYDAGISIIWLQPKTTYTWNTSVFLDQGNAYRQFVIYGNGSVIQLGSGIRTSDWPVDTTTRFALYPNTNRTAGTGQVVVDGTTRSTATVGQLKGATFYNLTVNGQGDNNRGFVFANRSTCVFHTCTAYQLRVMHTWDSYTDGNSYYNCYNRGVSVVADTSWFVYQYSQGDGIIIESPKADAGTGFARLKTCRGAFISGNVTAPIQIDDSTGIVFSAPHLEGQQSAGGSTQISMTHSQVAIYGGVLYENWSTTNHTITIDDTTAEMGSELTLDACSVISLFDTDSIISPFSSVVHIGSATGTTRIVSRNLKGMMASTAMAGQWVDHRQPRITSDDANITALLATPRGRTALASGTFELKRNAPNVWALDTIAPQVFGSVRQSARPTVSQVSSSSGVVSGGGLVNGTLYEYSVAVIDSLGNYSQASLAVSGTAGTAQALRLLLSISDVPATIIVWRKTAAGVLTAPDRYAILNVRSPRTYLYDGGTYISGVPWITTSVPIPNTVAAANGTVAAVSVNGTALSGMTGVPTYISTTEPSDAGPLFWIKDLGGGNYAMVVKTP